MTLALPFQGVRHGAELDGRHGGRAPVELVAASFYGCLVVIQRCPFRLTDRMKRGLNI
jgi:hypothetical protein